MLATVQRQQKTSSPLSVHVGMPSYHPTSQFSNFVPTLLSTLLHHSSPHLPTITRTTNHSLFLTLSPYPASGDGSCSAVVGTSSSTSSTTEVQSLVSKPPEQGSRVY